MLSPLDVIKRSFSSQKNIEWRKGKRLRVAGESFFGDHYFYIDEDLRHIVFLPKADKTMHVFIGDVDRATEWRKYDSAHKEVAQQDYGPKGLEWKIYEDEILYRGKALPKKIGPYHGKVVQVEDFSGKIEDGWIAKQIPKLFQELEDKTAR